jgi:prevent-host-death family protein
MAISRSIAETRHALAELVHQAEAGEAVCITRRGKPIAMLIAEAEYQRLKAAAAGGADFAAWAQAWRESLPEDFEGITADEIAHWRDV